ncbi:MAG: hypoxia response transcriptional regulator [Chloroflexota bacterium]
MNIGELARRSGVPTTALRYYEKAGLLPAPLRTPSGYRTYEADTLPRLAFLRAAQAFGLTLGEIREIIGIRDAGSAPCAHVLELIERHRREVHSRIRDLRRLERDLRHIASQAAGVDPSQCDPAGVCAVIPTAADQATRM